MSEHGAVVEYVTMRIGKQLFGLPILEVEEVFSPRNITEVPLSGEEVAGVLNLRGRIVTVMDVRKRLHMAAWKGRAKRMAVGIEYKGESYGLLVDGIGEVLCLPESTLAPNPPNLTSSWSAVSAGVCQLDGELMVVLDVERILNFGAPQREDAA